MDSKGISEIIGKFKSGQRVFVLILILVFSSGTYIITSKFKKSDCSGYQTEINDLYSNVDKMQQNQNRLVKTNQELYLLLDSIQNMLIQKRKDDLKSLNKNSEPIILKSVQSGMVVNDSLIKNDDSIIVSFGASQKDTPKPITNKKGINDIKFIDKLLKIINKKK